MYKFKLMTYIRVILILGSSLMFQEKLHAETKFSCAHALTYFYKYYATPLSKYNPQKSLYSAADYKQIKKMFEFLKLKENEDRVVQALNTHTKKVNLDTISDYLLFANTRRGRTYYQALDDIALLGQEEESSSALLKKFNRMQEQMRIHVAKSHNLYVPERKKQLSWTFADGTDGTQLILPVKKPQLAGSDSLAFLTKEYRSLYYGCRSTTSNIYIQNAKRIYTKFSISLSLLSTGASYAYTNREHNHDFEWWAVLGYDLLFQYVTSNLGSKVQTNPRDAQWLKSAKGYLIGRAQGLVDIAIFPAFFYSHQRAEAYDKVEALKRDPNYQAKVDTMMKFFNDRSAYAKFRDNLTELIRKAGVLPTINGVNFHELTEEQLNSPEIKDILVLAALAETYEQKRGEIVDSGDKGLDRYEFSTILAALLIPKSIAKQYITYQLLCMGQNTPILSFIETAVFHSVTSFLENNLYLELRHDAINQ